MDAESWILLGGAIAPILGGFIWWLVTIEQRMLTREEYERITHDARQDTDDKLDKILRKINEAEEAARDSRHRIGNAVHDLSLKVAVLADRAGIQR